MIILLVLPVREFFATEADQDNQLEYVLSELDELKNQKDVRTYLADRFQIKDTLKESKML